MALNRSDKSRILRRYFPGMTRNSEMSTEPSNRSDNVSVCIDKTMVAKPAADEPGIPWNSLNKTSSGRPCSENF